MSFFRTVYQCNCKPYNISKIQKYLRAMANPVYLKSIKSRNKSKSFCFGKRMSPSPSCICYGSMTVEAALTVPVFLFFVINILFAFEIMRLQSSLTAALHQTGNRIAFSCYTAPFSEPLEGAGEEAQSVRDAGLGELVTAGVSAGAVKGEVIRRLGTDYLEHSPLLGGSASLDLGKSSIQWKERDIIELVASFQTRPFIKAMGFRPFPMESRYYGRAWTGYDVTGGPADGDPVDPVVFIAQTGTVYHWERSCAYLNPSVELVSRAAVPDRRNENGGKYFACEKCGNDSICAVLFVTSQGNRYHSRLGCSSLKRTVYTVRLSEAGGRSECSKCGDAHEDTNL